MRLAFGLVVGVCLANGFARAADHVASDRVKSGSVAVSGLVDHPQSFSVAQLKAMPARRVDAAFATMHGQEHHVWTGALLWDVVHAAGLRDAPGRRTTMRHVFLAGGTDGYSAAVSIGEIDPGAEGKQVIVAYEADGAPISLRLIVPGDHEGARQVHDLSALDAR